MTTIPGPRGAAALLALGAVLAAAACDDASLEPIACTAVAMPAVVVRVHDALSGAPLVAGVSLVLQDGAFVDSVRVGDPPPWYGETITTPRTYERPGTYEVRVRREGYGPWARAGVVVRADACHVATVTLDVGLLPLS